MFKSFRLDQSSFLFSRFIIPLELITASSTNESLLKLTCKPCGKLGNISVMGRWPGTGNEFTLLLLLTLDVTGDWSFTFAFKNSLSTTVGSLCLFFLLLSAKPPRLFTCFASGVALALPCSGVRVLEGSSTFRKKGRP